MTLVVALANAIEKETKSWPGSHGLHTKLGLEHFGCNLDFISWYLLRESGLSLYAQSLSSISHFRHSACDL